MDWEKIIELIPSVVEKVRTDYVINIFKKPLTEETNIEDIKVAEKYRGKLTFDKDVCIGCGLCAETCPKKIISLMPQVSTTAVMCSSEDKGAVARKACTNACIGCKKCELNCPHDAIKVENNLAKIDYSKCTGCGKCVEVCPTHCIKSVKVSA